AGVVLLKKAVKLSAGQYGRLPTQDQLDALQPRSSTVFTAVGYGLQEINPVHIESQRIRMFAEPHLIQINGGIVGDFSLLLSNNASTGGTCFGDSGGPNYLGTSNVIAGVTSFGLNGTCGVAQAGRRRFRAAIRTLTRGLTIAPNDAVPYRWRGHRYLSVREFDRALDDLTRGSRLDSTNYSIWYHLGIVRYARGDFAAAAD